MPLDISHTALSNVSTMLTKGNGKKSQKILNLILKKKTNKPVKPQTKKRNKYIKYMQYHHYYCFLHIVVVYYVLMIV